jgi:hypothetical protein
LLPTFLRLSDLIQVSIEPVSTINSTSLDFFESPITVTSTLVIPIKRNDVGLLYKPFPVKGMGTNTALKVSRDEREDWTAAPPNKGASALGVGA